MATVINLPRDPNPLSGVAALGGALLGRKIRHARERKLAERNLKAFEAATGQDFTDEAEQAIIDSRVTDFEDLASFMAGRRAAAQEQRAEDAAEREEELHPHRLRLAEESVETAELGQRKTRQDIQQAGQIEVDLFNPKTNEDRKAIVPRAVLEGKKPLPKPLRDEGWQLGKPDSDLVADAGSFSGLGDTEKERAIRDFLLARGADPSKPADRDAARRALEGRDKAVKNLSSQFGEKVGDSFVFPGKRRELFDLAASQVQSIIWQNYVDTGSIINSEQAASIAAKRAIKELGDIEEPTPKQRGEQELQQLEAEDRRADEPTLGERAAQIPGLGKLLSSDKEKKIKQDPVEVARSAIADGPSDKKDRVIDLLSRNRLLDATTYIEENFDVTRDQAREYVISRASE